MSSHACFASGACLCFLCTGHVGYSKALLMFSLSAELHRAIYVLSEGSTY